MRYSLTEDMESLSVSKWQRSTLSKSALLTPIPKGLLKKWISLSWNVCPGLLSLLNMAGSMQSVCYTWPRFPLGYMAQKPEYSSWATKPSLDTLCPAAPPVEH